MKIIKCDKCKGKGIVKVPRMNNGEVLDWNREVCPQCNGKRKMTIIKEYNGV